MLPKKLRLKKQFEFKATYKQKSTFSDNLMLVYVGKKKFKEEINTKVGIVISKKIDKRAVKRNRLKRLIREAYRLLLKENSINPKWVSLIFIPRQSALQKDYGTIKESVLKCILGAEKKYG